MRLLYLAADPQRIGGVARSLRRVSDELNAREGIEARVLQLTPDDSPVSPDDFRAILTGALFQLWNERVKAACADFRPDILVGYYGSQGAYAAVVAGLELSIPSVACLRGNDVNLDYFSPVNQHLLQLAVTRADAVTTVSTEMAGKLRAWYGREATFISNSVDRERYRPDPDAARELKASWEIEGPLVGLFGEFKTSRGLAALAGLEEALHGATTMIVGSVRPQSRKEVPAWARAFPYIEDERTLRAAYCACDLVLQPSTHDGMPNVALEAMACGRVVVGSRTGGLIDIIDDGRNGFLCGPGDWPATIRRLLAEPRADVGAAARASVPSPRDEADAFLRLFRTVLGRA
jgi:glycosyltransferase involved in cell wall biosynthesis